MKTKRAGLLTKLVVLALLVFVASALLNLRTQIQGAQADLAQLQAERPPRSRPTPTCGTPWKTATIPSARWKSPGLSWAWWRRAIRSSSSRIDLCVPNKT